MRFVTCLLYGLIVFPNAASSLPFARAARKKEEEDSNSSNNVRGAASKASKAVEEFAPSTVVEAFFQNSLSDLEVSSSLKDTIRKMANTKEMLDFLQSVRRKLHRKPELMYQLPETSETIQNVLDELGIEYSTGWAKNTHEGMKFCCNNFVDKRFFSLRQLWLVPT